ncbi:MAG TPA: hypothetical protein VFO85_01090 [Vicinamibacteria bacterium]|nr:hypothetical protein [Vicinamibacteria bacterium]
MRRLTCALVLLACAGCGSDATTTPPSAPPPDFTLTCQPTSFGAGGGCGNSACTLTSVNGFAGPVTLACSRQPDGLECGFGTNPVSLTSGGSVTLGFTVAAGPGVPDRVHAFEVAATSGALRRTTPLNVQTVFAAPPRPVSSRSFLVSGCAGYVDGVLGPGTLQAFTANFVAARNDAFRGPQCVQALAAPGGRFDLEIPRGCFGDAETVFLTAGGLPACATRPFEQGGTAWAVLLGRRSDCP